MATRLVKILFTSMIFSAAVPSALFSSEQAAIFSSKQELRVEPVAKISNSLFPTLISALNRDDVETLKNIINNQIEFGSLEEGDGYRKVGYKLFMKYPGVLELFIEKKEGLVNSLDGVGQTPLQSAACSDNVEMIRMLIRKGAKVNDRGGLGCLNGGKRPLDLLLSQPKSRIGWQANFEEIKKLLLDNEAALY